MKEKVFTEVSEVSEFIIINEYQEEYWSHILFYCLFLFSRRTFVGIESIRKIMVRGN